MNLFILLAAIIVVIAFKIALCYLLLWAAVRIIRKAWS